MYYTLSNTFQKEKLERYFGASFEHPNLYRPALVIHGCNESNVPIITSENPNKISLGIWGILPERYQEDWRKFQHLTNTLHIDKKHIKGNLWYKTALEKRRCLFLVTGYYTYFLKDGVTYPYHVGLSSGAPFCLAGMYTILEDGFITCSFLVDSANRFVKGYQNLVDYMPMTIEYKAIDFWLNASATLQELDAFLAQPNKLQFSAAPVSKSVFNQKNVYDSYFERNDFEDMLTSY